ncbi:unnamed protein product [Sphagnum jensenii]|uniref:BTB/POZ domain-containing protein n=1 Tax=Sphagnum jensenii TaxID=128206 RepID=A0ABP0VVJ9_9BRYO
MLLYSEIFLFSGEWLTDDGCLSPIWPLVNEVSLCVTCRCATSLRQFCLCAQSFASRPVPYREACGGNGNGRRVAGCCCCCWRFSSIGFCFCNFCGVLKLLGTHSLELPFNPDGSAAMLMEVWPKDDESSITLRLAPPLRLEADGSGMPTEVWLKEDEISDVTLRLVPLQQAGGNSEQQQFQRQEDSEKGPLPCKKSRKQGPSDLCRRGESQEQGQSSKKMPEQVDAVATLHVHAAYLRRCQYFDACLAERWSKNDLPLDLTLEARSNPRAYTRCMQLLYAQEVSPSSFENVAHAIEVMPVAAQLVFQDCVDNCMQYLALMPWSPEDLSAIRCAVLAFQIAPSPDLAARLGTFGNLARDSSLDALKKVLETLLMKSMQLNAQDQMLETKVLENRAAFERLLKVSMRGPAVSKSVATVVKAVMYDALQRAVDDFRQHCRIPHMYKDEEFSIAGKEYAYSGLNFVQDTCNVLVRYLDIVAKGEIWLENSVRLALVEAWLPELVTIDFCIYEATKKNVDKALNGVLKTLPPLEQVQYLKSWPTQNWPNLSEAFDAWCGTMCSNLAFLESDEQQLNE